VPALANAESLFGRIQTICQSAYAPVFIAGLNYWAQGFGNYWGTMRSFAPTVHAILRSAELAGAKTLRRQILSHDFVEAALLLKENWQVWFCV